MTSESIIAIGGIHFRLRAASDADNFELDSTYEPHFTADKNGSIDIDVELTVHYRTPPALDSATEIFDSEGAWKLMALDGSYCVLFESPAIDPPVYKALLIDQDFTRGDIYIEPASRSGARLPPHRFPLYHPLDEMLAANVLSRGRGAVMHALGVDFRGRGILFSGTSGTGKSTLGNLWRQKPEAMILSSDRLIVRNSGRPQEPDSDAAGFWLYGTPWHGVENSRAYGGVPLARIILLAQAPRNSLKRLSPSEAATALLVHSFPTFWEKEGMRFALGFIDDLCSRVPCYRLGFRPEPEALDVALDDLPAESL